MEIDPIVANVVGYNAGVSIDSVARNALGLGTQVSYLASGASRASTANTDVITAASIRTARARLRSQNVPTFGGMYVSYIHPDAVYDLQSEGPGTSSANWRAPHIYSQPGEIWSGELGAFEGVRFIETPRALSYAGAGTGGTLTALTTTNGSNVATYSGATGTPVTGDLVAGTSIASGTVIIAVSPTSSSAGSVTLSSNATATTSSTAGAGFYVGGANVYGTVILGRQALAKAHSIADGNGPVPHVVPGPVVDHLRRLVPMGWYWLGAYGVFRQAAAYRIEHGSSLGADLTSAQYGPDINEGE